MKRFLMAAGMLIGSASVQAAPDFSDIWALASDKWDLSVNQGLV
jgi:hypothetical protein